MTHLASQPPARAVREAANTLTQYLREYDTPVVLLRQCRTLQDLIRHRLLDDKDVDSVLRDGGGEWALSQSDTDRAWASLEDAVASQLERMNIIGPRAEDDDLEPGDDDL